MQDGPVLAQQSKNLDIKAEAEIPDGTFSKKQYDMKTKIIILLNMR